jgi:hypothetical protein
MSRPTSPTYRTRNWPAYNEALMRRGSLTIWFDPKMSWEAAPKGQRGRQQSYSDTTIQTCLTMKVLFGMALRQTTGFVESLLRLVGSNWAVPDFSTLNRRQKSLAVNIPYRGSKGPLHLLIDSTGIKFEGEGEQNARKHGGPKRRVWCKIHLGIDRKRWRSAPSRSPGATSAMPRCCPICSARYQWTKRSAEPPQTAPTILESVTTRPPIVAPTQSSHRARMPSRRRPSPPARSHETRRCGHLNTSAGRSGDDGADTTGSPPKPRRGKDALFETAGPTPEREVF